MYTVEQKEKYSLYTDLIRYTIIWGGYQNLEQTNVEPLSVYVFSKYSVKATLADILPTGRVKYYP